MSFQKSEGPLEFLSVEGTLVQAKVICTVKSKIAYSFLMFHLQADASP